MHCGPLPADLSPLAAERGYSRAWLAYALRLDALGEANLGDLQYRARPPPLPVWDVCSCEMVFPCESVVKAMCEV